LIDQEVSNSKLFLLREYIYGKQRDLINLIILVTETIKHMNCIGSFLKSMHILTHFGDDRFEKINFPYSFLFLFIFTESNIIRVLKMFYFK